MPRKFRELAGQPNFIRACLWMLFLICILVCILIIAMRHSRHREAWFNTHRGISHCIENLQTQVPPDTDKHAWRNAVGRCAAGLWNGCHSPNDTTLLELKILHDDIGKIIAAEPVSTKTLWSIWNRIGETNKHAGNYIRKCEPDFREIIQPVESEPAPSH